MTTVIYNSVILRDCETQSFDQTIEYDDSKTDALYSRFRIRVASTLVAIRNVINDPQFGIDILEPNAATTVIQRAHEIQARLSQPRADFWMLVDQCVTDERQGGDYNGPILNQPLLIAAGKAWDDEIAESSAPVDDGYETCQELTRTPLFMLPNPLDTITSDTPRYGFANVPFAKEGVLDCENGPKPKKVTVTKIIGGRSLRVEFEIEICLRICDPDFVDSVPTVFGGVQLSSNRVLSNRWSLEESKDESWVTTRSLQGTLRVAHSDFWPHAMRSLCIPPLLRGYQRVRQSFVSDPTDLILKYRIDDRQAHASPPPPAVSWSGHHSESATGPNGMIKMGEVTVRLTGQPGVDKSQLIGAAGKLIVKRINGLVPERDPGTGEVLRYSTILKNASVTDVLDKPTIEMRVQVQYTDAEYKALALRIKKMGEPLDNLGQEDTDLGQGPDDGTDPYWIDGYDPKVWPVPLPYDSLRPAGVFACYLQNPCSVWHDMVGGVEPCNNALAAPTREPTTDADDSDAVEYEEHDDLPEDNAQHPPDSSGTADLYSHPYSFIELQQRYRWDNGYVQLPYADTASLTSCAIIKLHKRVAQRVLTLTARRNGMPPMIPSLDEEIIDPNGYREVMKSVEIVSKAPTQDANGLGRQFEVWCEYVYLMEDAPTNTEKLRGTSSPLDLFGPSTNWLDLSQIQDQAGKLQ